MIPFPICDCGRPIVGIYRTHQGGQRVAHFKSDKTCEVTTKRYLEIAQQFLDIYDRSVQDARLRLRSEERKERSDR